MGFSCARPNATFFLLICLYYFVLGFRCAARMQRGRATTTACGCPTKTRSVTVPMAWRPCLSSSKHHAECMERFGLDLIKLSGAFVPRHLLFAARRGRRRQGAFVSHLDLGREPYVLYGVKYIDLVSLGGIVPRYFLFSYHVSVYMR